MAAGRRRKTPLAPRAVVAGATRARVGDRKALAKLAPGGNGASAWQTEAWGYYDETPEVKFTTMWAANLLARVRMYVAVVPEGAESGEPIEVGAEGGPGPAAAAMARDELAALRPADGGQAAILGPATANMDVAGEFYLVGRRDVPEPDPDRPLADVLPPAGDPDAVPMFWEVHSISEVERSDTGATLRTTEKGEAAKLGDQDELLRCFRRHPRWAAQADSHVRGVLSECRALQVYSQLKVAEALSRHNAGILAVPAELSFGPSEPADPDEGANPLDPLLRELTDALTEPIADPSSPASVVPFLIRGPAAVLAQLRHLPISRVTDGTLDARVEATVQRLARGLDAPVEIVMGHQQTTFANADQVDEDAFTDHLESRLLVLLDAFTWGYLRPNLKAKGYPEEWLPRTFVWYDASAIVRPPDKSGTAAEAWRDGLISDEARRNYQGFTADDAPELPERLARLAITKGALDPAITAELLRLLAGALLPAAEPEPAELPAAPEPIDTTEAEPAPEPEAETAVSASAVRGALALLGVRAGPHPRVPRAH